MKQLFLIISLLLSSLCYSQYVSVDSQTYTPQELIELVLLNSNCVPNSTFTNVLGGNFNGTDESYGYFDASGSTFPFQNGVVLSTGRLQNVEGPNISLSDDDAPNWNGDNDLETILNETNTHNATILEFEFSTIADQINFRYIFASEEYQENNPNTCQYSDSFAFLIKHVNDQGYTNIAVIPNTQPPVPVKVTTVHPDIPNGCTAQNEQYFGSWNGTNAPINFNGQTAVLTATYNVIPNETYHVKLVIADEENYRYDSAVFLEGGSFSLGKDLGENRLFVTNNPLCDSETLTLDATMQGNNTYQWFKDNVLLTGETNATYAVTAPGVYSVEITLQNNCIANGEITIEYAENLYTNPNYLSLCDNDNDGITFFDLHLADPFFTTSGYPTLPVIDFYLTEDDAIQNINPIPNPNSFINTIPMQVVFARLENEYGCYAVEPLTLQANYTSSNITTFEACDEDNDGFTTFDLDELRTLIEPEVSQGAEITFYSTYQDAANHTNQLSDSYINTSAFSQVIYVKAQITFCELFTTINLNVNNSFQIMDNENISYCINNSQNLLILDAGVLNDSPNNYSYQWFLDNQLLNETTSSISVNETGTYKVIATHPNGCSASREINVLLSNIATITNIDVQQMFQNNSVIITVSGEGDYEFSLDHGLYQENNTFTNVVGGFHTVYIRDKNNCGSVEETFPVLDFPKFFTPNGDSYQDTWQPLGANTQFNSNLVVNIYDRFGKLLKEIRSSGDGWNGTFNGDLLPTDDYWYVVLFPDGKEYRGHFALKR
ncbi:MAG TPA: choice-of-anchor L domain-containing protein [Flavobacteriaceae bacterium]|nr:choice-of-anchor L domain-containing protein [Flavobacteriaceae bacterium]